jgi:sporulation protein YlmC with PRC-barrel domain
MARDPVTRGLRDEADVGPDPRAARELRRLSELRYRVADGEPDIRGWTVYASTGRELGTVRDLLVDTDAGEVVMLDVDLRRGDRHTLAPIRAAWIDHATRRVVLDAREAERALAGGDAAAPVAAAATGDAGPADDADAVPALPRTGTLSDDEVRRFNDDYARAYGARGVDEAQSYRLRRGEEELRFGAGPRRLLDPAAADRPNAAQPSLAQPPLGRPAAQPAADARLAESERINAELAAPPAAAARRDAAHGATHGAARDAEYGAARDADRGGGRGEDLAAMAAAADARFAAPPERRVDRVDRADDALAMDDAQGIDPRELDGRVRIDEGGTVDDRTPVAGVRYDEADPVPHHYGQPADAYGPEYGSGRIGFDRVVSRGPYVADADAAAAGEDRPLRYRRYPDAPTGDAR